MDKILPILSFDNVEDFKQTMNLFPVGNIESNREYLLKYKKGDIEARDMLVYTNLRLVFKIAEKLSKNAKSFQLLDCLNEGVLGLIDGLERFDITKEGFTKYISVYIEGYIRRALTNYDYTIRRSADLLEKAKKLRKIISNYEKQGLPIPGDEELCIILNVTKSRLEEIKNDYLYDTISTNTKLNEDDDSSELEDFISGCDESTSITLSLENKSLLSYLKQTLTSDQYYIIYYRFLTDPPVSTEEIGKRLSVSRQRIDQKEKKILLELKSLCSNGFIDYKNNNLGDLDNFLPIDPENIILYLFFRDRLTEEEKRVFKLKTSEKYLKDRDYAKYLDISESEYKNILNSCYEKMTLNKPKIKEEYEFFKLAILKEFQTKIFNVDLDCDLSKICTGIQHIHNEWKDKDYETAVKSIGQSKLDSENNTLLRRFFNTEIEKSNINLRSAEKEVNIILYGLDKHTDLPQNKLYETLINNKDRFTDEEYDFLLMSKFGKISKKEFNKKYPNTTLNRTKKQQLNLMLEELYFNIFDYTRNVFFNREKYLKIRNECIKKIDSLRISLLDMYYGIGEKKYSLNEIVDISGLSYEEVKQELQRTRTLAQKVYTNSTSTITFDETKYIPYIVDPNTELNEDTRAILTDFIINHKSYDELSKIYKKKNIQISHIVTDGLKKIDFYRFGILRTEDKYSIDDLKAGLSHPSLTDEERQIIRLCLDSKYSEAYSILEKQKVKNLMIRFYRYCYKHKIDSVKITEEDIVEEVNKHISVRVINDSERLLLSFLYGIENDLNPHGYKYSKEEMIKLYPKFKGKCKRVLDEALDKIRASKIKLIRPTFGYMERDTLAHHLQNKRLPISDKERELLCYSFGLQDHPYKDLNELQSIFGDSLCNIRNLIQKAFVNIYKYENHEIEGRVSIEEDILPYLKYFTKFDQQIITDKYLNNLANAEIAKKYDLTNDQIDSRLFKIKVHLKDLQENYVNGFDFNYFWSNIDREDIPYYGDLTTAKRVFYLYFEQMLSIEEISSTLNLNCSYAKINRILDYIRIAVLKSRENIKKPIIITYEEIKEYYLNHESSMNYDHKKTYQYYLNKVANNNGLNHVSISNVSPYILIDLLKERNTPIFDITKTDRQEVISILRKYRNRLTEQTIYTLLSHFNITERELMNGKEQRKVLKLLASVKKQSYKKAA